MMVDILGWRHEAHSGHGQGSAISSEKQPQCRIMLKHQWLAMFNFAHLRLAALTAWTFFDPWRPPQPRTVKNAPNVFSRTPVPDGRILEVSHSQLIGWCSTPSL